ncbi:MAG: hypothetical protein PHY64_00205 [Eubacteriales bacterium]|nr:hypothetical protein [Eubacteriales bacterium]
MALIHFRDWARKVGISGDSVLHRIETGTLPAELVNGVYFIDENLSLPAKGNRWHPPQKTERRCVVCGKSLTGETRRSTCSESCRIELSNRSKKHNEANPRRGECKYIGQTFGELTLLSSNGDGTWHMRCSCGKICDRDSSSVIMGDTTSCGHVRADTSRASIHDRVGFVDHTSLSQIKAISSGKLRSSNTSGVTGVRAIPRAGYTVYVAKITFQRKIIHLGTFPDFASAVSARKEAEKIYFSPMIKKHKTRYK